VKLLLKPVDWCTNAQLCDHQQVMHAWLRLSGYQRLSMDVEEGLAQLMALLWLERQQPPPVTVHLALLLRCLLLGRFERDVAATAREWLPSMVQGSYEERLAAYLGKQIREDTTAVYGASSSGVTTVPAAAPSLALAAAPQPARLMVCYCIAGR
jgi:Protein DA1